MMIRRGSPVFLDLCITQLQSSCTANKACDHLSAVQAAEVADSHGISCEVIDLRSLLPWDRDTVESSVNKTGRLLVVHEAPITSGFGAEIVAAVSKRCFLRLESPPLRVCGYDTPFPLVYEPLYVPSVPKVVDAIHESIKF